MEPEIIICAAIKVLTDGYVVRGHRHADCFRTIREYEKYKGLTHTQLHQGFVTSKNRFVDRYEAHDIHFSNGDPRSGSRVLYSEDLY